MLKLARDRLTPRGEYGAPRQPYGHLLLVALISSVAVSTP